MNTENYFVIKPTTIHRKKRMLGDSVSLTESQARPLRNGGFVTSDKGAAERIAELIHENAVLQASQGKDEQDISEGVAE